MEPESRPVSAQAQPRGSFWLLGVGLLLMPVAVLIAAYVCPRLHVAGTAADVGAFAGATLLPLLALSLAALVEVRLAVALSVAALSAATLLISSVFRPAPVVTVIFVDSALLGLSWALGCTLGRRVQHASHLLSACVVAACADLVSLLSPEGPSHAIAESERALSVLATWFPVPGGSSLAPALGVGDLLFVALALGVVRAHALPYARCVAACAVGIALSGFGAAVSGRAVPALVPIAAMLVLALPAIRRLRRADRSVAFWSMLIAGTVALASLARTLLSAR